MTIKINRVEPDVMPLPEIRPTSNLTFLDHVNRVMDGLWTVPDFRQLLNTLTNSGSVTGKYEIDRAFAARHIQEEAAKVDLTEVATAKVTRVMRAIETLLRRDGLGRKDRLKMINAPSAAE